MAVSGLFKGLSGTGRSENSLRAEVLDDFEAAGIGWVWASDAEGRLAYLSDKAAQSLGCEAEGLIGTPLVDLFEIDRDNPEEKSDRSLNFLLSSRARLNELVVKLTDARGQPVWWTLTGQAKVDEEGNNRGYRGSVKNVTQEFQRKLEDSRMAEFDALTGLANRHRMNRKLDTTLAAYKTAKRTCALMLLDLDKFKYVNDTMGHPAGDDLLKQVAERLRAVCGGKGEIGRLGGDEFQLILPDMDDRGELGELADKVIQMLSSPYQVEGKRAIIGASAGISIAPYDGLDRDELVRSADLALYAAKNGGRGMYRFYSAELKDVEQERQIMLDDLREALAGDQLKLHYQPVVRASDHLIVGFEALMRWEHPDKGNIPPMHFIPIAEDSDMINVLGEWAIRRACEDAMQWPDTVRVAVNVSAKQFANKGFLAIVTNVLAETQIKPDRLELELTETVFMGDSEATENTFAALKQLGVRLALDDFGTGYSSLSYLRSAPFDKLKVDKSFVDSCTQKDQNSAKIIAAIIGLSNALGMDVTVEGVEAFDQFNLVCEKGAKYIQGWIYSKARPQDEILAEIASGGYKIKPHGPDQYRPERRSVFRRIGIIHEDHRYDAVMRDLSKTGSRIEGLVGVPVGTGLVLDMGGGQLVVCKVARSEDATIGVEFETPLISDGAGGLCTRHRISPYVLAAAGMPLGSLPPGNYPSAMMPHNPHSQPQFMQVQVSRGP